MAPGTKRNEVAYNDATRRKIGWIRVNSRLLQSTVVEANNDTEVYGWEMEQDLRETHGVPPAFSRLTPPLIELSNSEGCNQIGNQDQDPDESTYDRDDDEDDEYTEPDDRHDDDVETLVDHFLGSLFGANGGSGDGNYNNINNPSSTLQETNKI